MNYFAKSTLTYEILGLKLKF